MSDLAATNCGCGCERNERGGCGNFIWIILLLCCCGGNDCDNGFGGCGNGCGGDFILIILLLCCCGGNGFGGFC
ncbi:MAG: chorion class high-cysteine HCB protein 13 [Lachnospiraceae bacterium]